MRSSLPLWTKGTCADSMERPSQFLSLYSLHQVQLVPTLSRRVKKLKDGSPLRTSIQPCSARAITCASHLDEPWQMNEPDSDSVLSLWEPILFGIRLCRSRLFNTLFWVTGWYEFHRRRQPYCFSCCFSHTHLESYFHRVFKSCFRELW